MSPDKKKALGVISLALGLIAWLGERWNLISQRVADLANLISLIAGSIATFA
jgi:hypothetical protein